jgi:signal transduction histidine kinase
LRPAGVVGPLVRFVQVRVADTGHGIPREMLSRVFNPFFTTRSRGTGLGLSLAQSIVKEHGGFLTVRSVVDKGTVFHLDLPVERRHGERRKERR